MATLIDESDQGGVCQAFMAEEISFQINQVRDLAVVWFDQLTKSTKPIELTSTNQTDLKTPNRLQNMTGKTEFSVLSFLVR